MEGLSSFGLKALLCVAFFPSASYAIEDLRIPLGDVANLKSCRVPESVIIQWSFSANVFPPVYPRTSVHFYFSATGDLTIGPEDVSRWSQTTLGSHDNLTINGVKTFQSGLYTCTSLTSHDSSRILEVYNLIVIVPVTNVLIDNDAPDQLEKEEIGSDISLLPVPVGSSETITIACSVAGIIPAANLTWLDKNGNAITLRSSPDSLSPYVVGQVTTMSGDLVTVSLVLTMRRPTESNNRDRYSCTAEQVDQPVKRSDISLDVHYEPDSVTVSGYDPDRDLAPGDAVELICVVLGGNPSPSVHWLKNGEVIDTSFSTDRSDVGVVRNSLTISVDRSDDQAAYVCSAMNDALMQPKEREVILTVKFLPSQVTISGDSVVEKGQKIYLSCVSGPANPKAELTWMTTKENGINANFTYESSGNGGFVSTSFAEVIPAEGLSIVTVTCAASNVIGQISTTKVLSIFYPPGAPHILNYDEGAVVTEEDGNGISLQCTSYGGHPLPVLNWYYSDDLGSPLDNVRLENRSGGIVTSEITLLARAQSNGKRLICQSETQRFPPTNSSVSLAILYPPQSIRIISPASALVGEDATYTCEAGPSNPSAIITWNYRQLGTGGVVQVGPSIVTDTMQHAGKITKSTVTLTPQPSHLGLQLECTATNEEISKSKSDSTFLNVLYAPQFVSGTLASLDAPVGGTVSGNFTPNSNPPPDTYSLANKDGPVTLAERRKRAANGKISMADGVVTFHEVTRGQAGLYSVTATNSLGSATHEFNLNIMYSPISVAVRDIPHSNKKNVRLICAVNANPVGSVTWTKPDGTSVDVAEPQAANEFYLEIPAVQRSDQGDYICNASNSLGAKQTTYNLKSDYPPSIENPANNQKAGAGINQTAFLYCHVFAKPLNPEDVSWQKEGAFMAFPSSKYAVTNTRVGDKTVFQLTVRSVQVEDYGTYTCSARNALGAAQLTVRLDALSKPDTPLNVQVRNATANSILLSWEPNFGGGGTEVTFVIRYRQVDAKGSQSVEIPDDQPRADNVRVYTIESLKPQTEYEISVAAQNPKGSSNFTVPVRKTTEAAPPSEQEGIEENSTLIIILCVSLVASLLFINIVLVLICIRRRRKGRSSESSDSTSHTNTLELYGTENKYSPPDEVKSYSTYDREQELEEDFAKHYEDDESNFKYNTNKSGAATYLTEDPSPTAQKTWSKIEDPSGVSGSYGRSPRPTYNQPIEPAVDESQYATELRNLGRSASLNTRTAPPRQPAQAYQPQQQTYPRQPPQYPQQHQQQFPQQHQQQYPQQHQQQYPQQQQQYPQQQQQQNPQPQHSVLQQQSAYQPHQQQQQQRPAFVAGRPDAPPPPARRMDSLPAIQERNNSPWDGAHCTPFAYNTGTGGSYPARSPPSIASNDDAEGKLV